MATEPAGPRVTYFGGRWAAYTVAREGQADVLASVIRWRVDTDGNPYLWCPMHAVGWSADPDAAPPCECLAAVRQYREQHHI